MPFNPLVPGQPAPPDPDSDRLTVEIEGVGFQPNRILSYRINTQYTTPTDGWEFVVYSEDDPKSLRRRFRPLQPIKLYIAGNQQVIGRIDKIEGVGTSGSALKVSGRDYLADIVDSTVDPAFQIKKGQDIGAFMLDLLKPWGITTVFGNFNLTRNVMSGRKPFTRQPAAKLKSAGLEDTKASEGQGVGELLSLVLARQGFMWLPAGTRDAICVDAPNYEQAPLYTLSRPGNILSGNASRDYAGLPTVVIARGRSGGSQPGEQMGGANVDQPAITPRAGTPPGQKQFAANPTNDVQGTGRRVGQLQTPFALDPRNDVQGTGRRATPEPTTAASPGSTGSNTGKRNFGTFDTTAANSIGQILEVQRCITSDDGVIVVREKRFDPKVPDRTVYGYDFPVYKPLFYRDRDSRNGEQLTYSVRRMIAEKLRETLVYTCTVQGHTDPKSGAAWTVDTMVTVHDEIEDVDENLWVASRTFSNDGNSGPITELELVRPGSYVF